jgi:sugar/nucleoside kinase (ribokinase family)
MIVVVAAVLLTDGPNPVVCLTPTSTFEVDVPHTPVVDTVGARDAFGGAFLVCWIERGFGRDELGDEAAFHEALALAIQVATLTLRPVRRRSATP